MKKWLLLFLGMGVLALPWACGNSPTSPAPTPTFTPVPTNWAGYTSTITSTPTSTGTPTNTATSTPTNLGGNTSTFTPTYTFNPFTYTSTPTITSTPTVTNTITSTNTPTSTITPIPTSTLVPGNTPAPVFAAQWTSGIQYPNGVAVGLIGGVTQIFLAEGDPGTGVAQVQVLDGSGNPVTAWSSLGAISFVNPYGVATAGTTLFVLDNNGGTNNAGVLYAFNWDGTTLTSLASTTSFNYPEGVAVFGTTVYVSDTYNGNGTVDQFTFTGSSFTANSQSTGGTTAFLEPSGLAFNSAGTTVYVADAGNDLIQENSGSGWVTFASTNNFSSDDSDVYGVGVDSQGNVYACDVYNGLVQQFNSNGNYLSFTTGGSGTAAFSSPDGIALLGSHLIVSDYSNGTGSPYGTGSLVELIP